MSSCKSVSAWTRESEKSNPLIHNILLYLYNWITSHYPGIVTIIPELDFHNKLSTRLLDSSLTLLMSTLNIADRVIPLNSNLYCVILLNKFPQRLPIPLRAKQRSLSWLTRSYMIQVSCNISDLILSLSPGSLFRAPWPTYHVLNVPKSYFFKAFASCYEYSFSREHWLTSLQ